eukprot:scaffold9627_cov123-Isochrysis_galbana.AAC.6
MRGLAGPSIAKSPRCNSTSPPGRGTGTSFSRGLHSLTGASVSCGLHSPVGSEADRAPACNCAIGSHAVSDGSVPRLDSNPCVSDTTTTRSGSRGTTDAPAGCGRICGGAAALLIRVPSASSFTYLTCASAGHATSAALGPTASSVRRSRSASTTRSPVCSRLPAMRRRYTQRAMIASCASRADSVPTAVNRSSGDGRPISP